MLRRAAAWIPLLSLAAAIFLRWSDPFWLEGWRFAVFDSFQNLQPRTVKPLPVHIVDLDNATLERYGQWPWPRTLVAELLRRIQAGKPAAVVFDIVFAEPDRTALEQILKSLEDPAVEDALKPLLERLPDPDVVLAEQVRRGPTVVGIALNEDANDRKPAQKAGIAFAGDDPHELIPDLPGVVANLPLIEEAAAGQGHFNLLAEHGGVIRRVPLFLQKGGVLYPSITLEAMRVAQGVSTYQIKATGASSEVRFGEGSGITQVRVGSRIVPTDAHGRLWLHDSGPRKRRWIPAWKLLAQDSGVPDLKDAIVFIGTSASGLKDIRATPLNPAAAGVEVHAQLAEQILAGDFLYRPDWADGAELLLLVVLGLFCVVTLPRFGAVWCAVFGSAVLAAVLGGAWLAFRTWHWLLDPVMPALAVLLIYVFASLANYIRTESERRRIKNAFGRYLSPDLVSRLAESPGELRLGGESRDMTVLFSDIRGFTSISERMDAQELTRLINRYMTPMTEAVLAHRGTVDKYMGDGLMAFWNAPLEDPDHPRHAAESALEMRERLKNLNAELLADERLAPLLGGPLQIGIGMTRGEACVGNLGSEQRFDYSAVGDVVNLASRLENQAKVYGVDLIVDEAMRAALPGFALLELDRARVRGKAEPVRFYLLAGDEACAKEEDFRNLADAHRRMLEALRAGEWEEAMRALEECRSIRLPHVNLETLYAVYQNRIHAGQKGGDERRP